VWAINDTLTEADTLVVSSFPGLRRNYPAWVPAYLRARGLDDPPPSVLPERRLYVRRRSRQRTLMNDEAIAEVLQRLGFEIYDHARVSDEAAYFAQAACVVGPHDAGLANLAFCAPGTRVIELVPTDHVFPYYFTLAESAGLHYGYLAGHSTERRPEGTWGPSPFDFRIDTGECRTAVEELLL
jgi:capsular polysaccharide biosynthesis protein